MLFNLSTAQAQSPENGEAAKGQTEIRPLLVGQKVPHEFWTEKHLLYINGDTVRQDLSTYKDKVLILGFWATWCSPCLKNGTLIQEAIDQHPERFAYVKVNPVRTTDNISRIEKLLDGPIGRNYNLHKSNFSSIIEDGYLQTLFPHHGYPLYVWINNGIIQIMTFRNLFDQRIAHHLLGGGL
ncbi:TlpA family protein disulfide reductase [Sphingobacterium chuzhouense]|uniref:Redoxin domain-containing protein n=1 Tax=Sphingobacterium chuzhouense TaxID=1742264 RepID=A0ABR7XXH2_9SPHI|nr:thioredoxin domain-containing protein [Sphingobacterium chuzhouense]MBD1423754.1 redoxin domain-containing protein [Sphingobacterium chuzhouense]